MNDSQQRWDKSLGFLKAMRTGWCNDDYMEFLIDRVWKIDKPINVVDFGCGFGYIGMLFLPLLPEGSSYTGIDFSDVLLGDARRAFADTSYAADFIMADLNDYTPRPSYDLAISQAVLRHLPNPADILAKMIGSVVSGGLVVCMETDLEIEKAAFHFSGLDYHSLGLTDLYRRMYRNEMDNGGRDYRIGAKLPILMQESGLIDVGVRMNDSVKFINPLGNREENGRQYDAMTAGWGWDRPGLPEERQREIKRLMDRGLDESEAEMYVNGQAAISEYVTNHKSDAYVVHVPGTIISYGTKV